MDETNRPGAVAQAAGLERRAQVASVWQDAGMGTRNPAGLRERAVAAVDAGVPRAEVAAAYRVALRTLERWVARARRGEPLSDRPRSGRPPKLDPALHPVLRALAAARPDATLGEHAAGLDAATGVRLSPSRVGRLLAGLGLRRKKRR
jgi:transposase